VLALPGAAKGICGESGWICESSFSKVRSFQDEQDLKQEREEWHLPGDRNHLRPAEKPSRPRRRKVRPEEFALRIPVYGGPHGNRATRQPYSMPPQAVSIPPMPYLYTEHIPSGCES
jgi:hypothetical protein